MPAGSRRSLPVGWLRIALDRVGPQQLRNAHGEAEEDDQVHTPDGLIAHREAYLGAIHQYAARGADARSWTLQFLIRRSAYHMLDHAWEMEDKDMSPAALVAASRGGS